MTLGLLLHPERASRLVNQESLQPGQLGLDEVISSLIGGTIKNTHNEDYLSEVQQVVNFRVLQHLMVLANNRQVHPQVNAIAYKGLDSLKKELLRDGDSAIAREMLRRITRFETHPEEFEVVQVPKIPDGSPIGMACTQD
jgi:hypothetical protein